MGAPRAGAVADFFLSAVAGAMVEFEAPIAGAVTAAIVLQSAAVVVVEVVVASALVVQSAAVVVLDLVLIVEVGIVIVFPEVSSTRNWGARTSAKV